METSPQVFIAGFKMLRAGVGFWVVFVVVIVVVFSPST